jgi:hypothetical protein
LMNRRPQPGVLSGILGRKVFAKYGEEVTMLTERFQVAY